MVDADANKAGRPGLSLGREQRVGRTAPRHTDLVDNEAESITVKSLLQGALRSELHLSFALAEETQSYSSFITLRWSVCRSAGRRLARGTS